MRYHIFGIIAGFALLLFLVNCDKGNEKIMEANPVSLTEIPQKPKNVAEEKSAPNENIRENDQTLLASTVRNQTTIRNDEPLSEYLMEILKNEIKDFSAYETPPLDQFLGKWNLLDQTGNIHDSKFSIEIFYDGSQYRYFRQYYGSLTEGRIVFTDREIPVLWPDNISNSRPLYRILSKPVRTVDGGWAIFLDNEGPVGYFLREDDIVSSVWEIEKINGSWISDYSLIDGTLFAVNESLSQKETFEDISVVFDLEQKTVRFPDYGLFMINVVLKDEEGSICLKLFSADDKAEEEPLNIKIIPLDFAKAYLVHDRWEKWQDRTYSPEEKWVWYRLSGPGGK